MLSQQKSTSGYPCFIQVFEDAKDLHLPVRPQISLDDGCILQYTGGTTGVSKGAELTHRNVLANSIQTLERLGKGFKDSDEIIICPLPLYHIYAFYRVHDDLVRKRCDVRTDPQPKRYGCLCTTN